MGWGDELMITGRARVMQETDPRKVRVVYEKGRWHEAWDHNPRIAGRGEQGDFQELVARIGYLRPYIAAKTDRQWTWKPYGPPRGELYFTDDELGFGEQHKSLVIVEPHLKPGASPNKEWGWERWAELARLLGRAGIEPVQLGRSLPRLLPGTRWIRTGSMRYAAALIARARLVVVPEGGLHHVAAAVGTPAVVIYGGYISPEVTGYQEQTAFFSGEGLGCGMRVACDHCERVMAGIEPDAVAMAAIRQRRAVH